MAVSDDSNFLPKDLTEVEEFYFSKKENYDLSIDFYITSFEQTIKILMRDYGPAIYSDLTLLLREIIISKINYLRIVEQNIFNRTGKKIKFEEALDPYEALDMFISYPKIVQHESFFFYTMSSDWKLVYGEGIVTHLAKLFLAFHRIFSYQYKSLYNYLEHAFEEKYNHSETFFSVEQLISNLQHEAMLIEKNEKEKTLEEEISKLNSVEIYHKPINTIYKKLSLLLDPEIMEDINNLISYTYIRSDYATASNTKMIEDLVNKELEKEDKKLKVKIDNKFKYRRSEIESEKDSSGFQYNSAVNFIVNIEKEEDANNS